MKKNKGEGEKKKRQGGRENRKREGGKNGRDKVEEKKRINKELKERNREKEEKGVNIRKRDKEGGETDETRHTEGRGRADGGASEGRQGSLALRGPKGRPEYQGLLAGTGIYI